MIEVKEVTNAEYAALAAVNDFKCRVLRFLIEHSEQSYSYENSFVVNKAAMLAVLDGKEPVVVGGEEDSRELDKDKQEDS